MVETPTGPNGRAESGAGRRGRALAAGTVASVAILAATGGAMAALPMGVVGDLLLAWLAVGVLFRLPFTLAVWSALTLLAAAALALLLGDQALSDQFANLMYYELVVGCLWAVWDLASARWQWRLPFVELIQARAARQGLAAPVLSRPTADERP